MTEDNHLMFRTEGILKNLHSRSKIILSGSQKDSIFLKQSIFSGRSDITSFFSLVVFRGSEAQSLNCLPSVKMLWILEMPIVFLMAAKDWLVPNWMYLFFYGFRIVILHPLQTLAAFAACFHQPNPTSSSWKGLLGPAASSTTSFLRCHLTPAQLGSQCATFVEIPFPALLWLQLLLNHQWLYPCRSTSISIYFKSLIYIYIFCPKIDG